MGYSHVSLRTELLCPLLEGFSWVGLGSDSRSCDIHIRTAWNQEQGPRRTVPGAKIPPLEFIEVSSLDYRLSRLSTSCVSWEALGHKLVTEERLLVSAVA